MGPIAWDLAIVGLVLTAVGAIGIVSLWRDGSSPRTARRGVIALVGALLAVIGVGVVLYAANFSGNLGR